MMIACPKCSVDFKPRKIGKTSRVTQHCSVQCAKAARVKHGHAARGKESPTYNSWNNMVRRCTKSYSAAFARYGAVGIYVCDRWLKFENFLADMGERPPNCTLDRVDNSRGYEPKNCRWATISEQQSNIRTNRFIDFRGQRKTLSEWAREIGCDPKTISYRLSRGWTIEQSLTIAAKLGNRVK